MGSRERPAHGRDARRARHGGRPRNRLHADARSARRGPRRLRDRRDSNPGPKDSIVSESHLIAFDLCTFEDLKIINRICSKINAVMKAFFERRHETVAEFTCSFGKHDGKIYLIDDFSPFSLKVFPNGNSNGWVNPYSLKTSSEMRKYTDFLLNLTSA